MPVVITIFIMLAVLCFLISYGESSLRESIKKPNLYSRRKVIELDILKSQVDSGWIYKENALVNPADVFNLTGQGKGLCLRIKQFILNMIIIDIQANLIVIVAIIVISILGLFGIRLEGNTPFSFIKRISEENNQK